MIDNRAGRILRQGKCCDCFLAAQLYVIIREGLSNKRPLYKKTGDVSLDLMHGGRSF